MLSFQCLVSINLVTLEDISKQQRSAFEERIFNYLNQNPDFKEKLLQNTYSFKDIRFNESTNELTIKGEKFYSPKNIPSNINKSDDSFDKADQIRLYTLFNIVYYGEVATEETVKKEVVTSVVEKAEKKEPVTESKENKEKKVTVSVDKKVNSTSGILSQWYVKYSLSAVTIAVPLMMTMKYQSDYDAATTSGDATDLKKKTKTFGTVTALSISANLVFHFYDDIKRLF